MLNDKHLIQFINESNAIEGIFTDAEQFFAAYQKVLDSAYLDVEMICDFVNACQPDAMLRDGPHIPGVRVGSHIAPPSSPEIRVNLENLLFRAMEDENPWQIHVEYETLHPFTDCNGRSGRLIWLWQMDRINKYSPQLKFLHSFYYQTLANSQRRS